MKKSIKNKLGIIFLLPLSSIMISTPLFVTSCSTSSGNSTIPMVPITPAPETPEEPVKPTPIKKIPKIQIRNQSQIFNKYQIYKDILFEKIKSKFTIANGKKYELSDEFKNELTKGHLFQFLKEFDNSIKSLEILPSDEGKFFNVLNDQIRLEIKVNVINDKGGKIAKTLVIRPYFALPKDLDQITNLINKNKELSNEFIDEIDGNKNIFALAKDAYNDFYLNYGSSGGLACYRVSLIDDPKNIVNFNDAIIPFKIENDYTFFNFKNRIGEIKELRENIMLEMKSRFINGSNSGFYKQSDEFQNLVNFDSSASTSNKFNDLPIFLAVFNKWMEILKINKTNTTSPMTHNVRLLTKNDIESFISPQTPETGLPFLQNNIGTFEYMRADVTIKTQKLLLLGQANIQMTPYVADYADILFASKLIQDEYSKLSNPTKSEYLKEQIKYLYDTFIGKNNDGIFSQFLTLNFNRDAGMIGYLANITFEMVPPIDKPTLKKIITSNPCFIPLTLKITDGSQQKEVYRTISRYGDVQYLNPPKNQTLA